MVQKAHSRAEYRGGKHLYKGYSKYKNIHGVVVRLGLPPINVNNFQAPPATPSGFSVHWVFKKENHINNYLIGRRRVGAKGALKEEIYLGV